MLKGLEMTKSLQLLKCVEWELNSDPVWFDNNSKAKSYKPLYYMVFLWQRDNIQHIDLFCFSQELIYYINFLVADIYTTQKASFMILCVEVSN